MSEKKELEVSAIENGTVIDHIPAEVTFKIVEILGLYTYNGAITIGSNLSSKTLGKKGIIKVSDKFFSDEEIGRLAVIAPNATLNIIKNYKIVEKKYVQLPKLIRNVVKCSNPKCITNHQPVATKMEVFNIKTMSLKCVYCERVMQHDEIEIL